MFLLSIIIYRDGSEELYDHNNDPDEFTNIAGDPQYSSLKMEPAALILKVNAEPNKK